VQHGSGISEWAVSLVEPVATSLELLGVVVIAGGTVIASVKFANDWRRGEEKAYDRYRANLGRAILLALELLVGADILATVTAPLTVQSVALLGVIVIIRTLLSFALETEIEGVAPWRRRAVEGETDRTR
jgi:uncharacterized membrane protein